MPDRFAACGLILKESAFLSGSGIILKSSGGSRIGFMIRSHSIGEEFPTYLQHNINW